MDTFALRAGALAKLDQVYSQFLTAVNGSHRLRRFYRRMFTPSPDADRLWAVLFTTMDVQAFIMVTSQELARKPKAGHKAMTVEKALAIAQAYDAEVAAGRKWGAVAVVAQANGVFQATVRRIVADVKAAKADAEAKGDLRLGPEYEVAVKARALPAVFSALMRGQ